MRYTAYAHHGDGQPRVIAHDDNVHSASNLAESYFRNNSVLKAYVVDNHKRAIADEPLPQGKTQRCYWETVH